MLRESYLELLMRDVKEKGVSRLPQVLFNSSANPVSMACLLQKGFFFRGWQCSSQVSPCDFYLTLSFCAVPDGFSLGVPCWVRTESKESSPSL